MSTRRKFPVGKNWQYQFVDWTFDEYEVETWLEDLCCNRCDDTDNLTDEPDIGNCYCTLDYDCTSPKCKHSPFVDYVYRRLYEVQELIDKANEIMNEALPLKARYDY